MKPKRTARQSGIVESFGDGMVPDYLVFTDEYNRRWRLESQFAQLEAENEALMGVLDRLADWLERVNDDPLGALTDGFPSPENVVIYLRQKSWEIKNKDALARKETPCP